jgi:phosphoserine phosphatase RsbU/P
VPDAAPGVTRLDQALESLGRLAGLDLRLWKAVPGGETADLWAGPPAPQGWTPGRLGPRGERETPEGPSWWEPLPEPPGSWLELRGAGGKAPPDAARRARDLLPAVQHVLTAEQDTSRLAGELRSRYEEIDLLYSISETLGQTIRLEEAASKILRDVAAVVRAQRASLFVLDDGRAELRLVAAHGLDVARVGPIQLDDEASIVARVARDQRLIANDPGDPMARAAGRGLGRTYRGKAFLSVPVVYPAPAGPRLIGVLNLTDREGPDSFGEADRRLVAAVANQIGAALENARLVDRDMRRQRMSAELELARDLQFKLLPIPAAVASEAQVATRCRPAEAVSGDFYNLFRVDSGVVGVMLGDVSGHGFGAALIMALAMSASGIHAQGTGSAAEMVDRLEDSLFSELARTEMFLTLFYGIVDRKRRRLRYVNAGLPGAFRVLRDRHKADRLPATRPPLGLPGAGGAPVVEATVPWRPGRDLLCLFTDGVADATNLQGARFGDKRVLDQMLGRSGSRPEVNDLLERVFRSLDAWTAGTTPADDRTVVLLRL